MPRSHSVAALRRAACLVLLLAAAGAGCMFRDVREQQQEIDAYCVIDGTLKAATAEQGPFIVALATANPGASPPWRAVDHFVMENAGPWVFVAPKGTYAVAAFEDVNRDRKHQPGEAFALDGAKPVTCDSGGRQRRIELRLPERSAGRLEASLDLAGIGSRTPPDPTTATLGRLTALGATAKLTDAKFADEVARGSLWRPLDFVLDGNAGVYFLEPYDPRKIPVLFVHGINGSPANFASVVAALDRERFQPWFFYYPSGARLGVVAQHLEQSIAKLQLRHGVERMAVVAHSMGGLVSRGFVQRHIERGNGGRLLVFVTIATPWGGHAAAELGVKTAPEVVRSWVDMAPGSDYLKSLESPAKGGAEPPHHLLFTFSRNSRSFGPSDDGVITLASQLMPAAQRNATRLYGFDDDHMSVLRDAEAIALVNRLLLSASQAPAR